MVKIPDIAFEQRGIDTRGAGVAPSIQQARQVGEAIEGVGSTILQFEQDAQEREAAAYVTRATAEYEMFATQRGQELQTEIDDIDSFTPTYMEELQARKAELLENAPNAEARELLEVRSLNVDTSAFNRATTFQADQKVAIQKQGLFQAVETYGNILRQDPTRFDELLMRTNGDLTAADQKYLNPAESEAAREVAYEELYNGLVTGVMAQGDFDAVDELLQRDDVIKNLSKEAYGSLQKRVNTEKTKISNLLLNDPAEWAQKTQGQMTPSESVNAQLAAGVPESMTRVLTKDQATVAVGRLTSAKTPQQLSAAVQEMQNAYGSEFSKLVRDLRDAGLQGDYEFALAFDPIVDNEILSSHYEVISEGEKEIRDLAKSRMAINDDRFTDLEREVSTQAEDYLVALARSGMPVEGQKQAVNSMINIAANYYRKGDDMDAAVEKATQWLLEKNTVVETNNGGVVIPNKPEYDVRKITLGMDDKIRTFTSDNVNLSFDDVQKELYTSPDNYARSIRENGGFITNEKSNGVYLTDSRGLVVFNKDLQPIEYLYEDLQEEIIEEQTARGKRRQKPVAPPLDEDSAKLNASERRKARTGR